MSFDVWCVVLFAFNENEVESWKDQKIRIVLDSMMGLCAPLSLLGRSIQLNLLY